MDVELFTFPEGLAVSARALKRKDLARRCGVSDRYSCTLRESLDFLAFAGLTRTSRMIAWFQILKPRMALIGAKRLASPVDRTSRTGERLGVTLINLGIEPIECILGQSKSELQTVLDCSADSEAENLLGSLSWGIKPIAIVLKVCEGAAILDVPQLLGFSTRSATHDVLVMMVEFRPPGPACCWAECPE
jgi:hypothetical protein